MNKAIYFGHPTNTYNTSLERDLLKKIEEWYPEDRIINPNNSIHENGYNLYKQNFGNGMLYYYTKVLPHVDEGIFLPFTDNMLSAGQYTEAEYLCSNNKPIQELSWDRDSFTLRDLVLDTTRRLSVEETRQRVKKPYKE